MALDRPIVSLPASQEFRATSRRSWLYAAIRILRIADSESGAAGRFLARTALGANEQQAPGMSAWARREAAQHRCGFREIHPTFESPKLRLADELDTIRKH